MIEALHAKSELPETDLCTIESTDSMVSLNS